MTQCLSAKRIERGKIARNSEVLKVPLNHFAQPCALFAEGQMALPKQRLLYREQLGAEPRAYRLPPDVEPLGLAHLPTQVGKAQESKSFRLALAALPTTLSGEPPEFDQPRFVRVQGQAELMEAFP